MRKPHILMIGFGLAVVLGLLVAVLTWRGAENPAREAAKELLHDEELGQRIAAAPLASATNAHPRQSNLPTIGANSESLIEGSGSSGFVQGESRDSTLASSPARTSGERILDGIETTIFRASINSDYGSYDKDTLRALARSGDVQALNKLFGKVSPRELCELSEVSFNGGHSMAYGLISDLVLGSTNDRTIARAYFYAWLHTGSQLAKTFESDYIKRTALTAEEDRRAFELARQLRVKNDCSWAPG